MFEANRFQMKGERASSLNENTNLVYVLPRWIADDSQI